MGGTVLELWFWLAAAALVVITVWILLSILGSGKDKALRSARERDAWNAHRHGVDCPF
jgi:hypothetical protein